MCLSASKGLTMIIVSFEFALVDHTIPLAEFYDSPFKTPLYQLLLLRKAKRVAVIFKDLL